MNSNLLLKENNKFFLKSVETSGYEYKTNKQAADRSSNDTGKEKQQYLYWNNNIFDACDHCHWYCFRVRVF